MMDITQKLENIADASMRIDGTDCPLGEQCREASSEIERLRAEVESARSDHAFATIGWERERGLREAAEARTASAEKNCLSALNYSAELQDKLAAAEGERDALKDRLDALYEWYDRDGSVGGASTVFEEHRAREARGNEAEHG